MKFTLRDVSLARRFRLLSLLILVCVALPTAALMQRLLSEQALVRQEAAGTPAALALLDLIGSVQGHRLQSLLRLSGQPEAEPARQAAAQRVQQHWQRARASLPQAKGLPERAQQFESGWQALATEVATEKLTAREAFERHGELLQRLDDLCAHVLVASGLLLDPDPHNYFLIIAGFQEGKTVMDQLAQLHDLGYAVLRQKGASPLDLNQLAASKARLEDRKRFFLQNLALARERAGLQFDPRVASALQATSQGMEQSLALVEKSFLGFSPDWELAPEQYAQTLAQAQAAQAELTSALAQQVSSDLAAKADRLGQQLLALAGLLGLLLAFMVWRLTAVLRAIVRPMAGLAAHSEQMASGDLRQPLRAESANELGQLTLALEAMRAQWGEILRGTQGSARELHAASQEISAENQHLSARTEQTAAALQQTSALVTQLNEDVQASASAAAQAHALAGSAASVAAQGAATVQQVVQTMSQIQGSSRRIADISGLIDGIAYQTNLLALNAAVEAARAGEQGRGVAVVASEVRLLAQRSASAAREIKDLIAGATARIEQGSALVQGAGHTMREIEAQVQTLSQRVQGISQTAGRQSQDIEQVHQALAALDRMTQQNASVAEQSAAGSETLAQLAERLAGAVQRFRLPAPKSSP